MHYTDSGRWNGEFFFIGYFDDQTILLSNILTIGSLVTERFYD